jgi:hypothetical protein
MLKEGFMETLVSVYSEHVENRNFRRTLETTLSRISREKFPEYFDVQLEEETVPSLLELSLRAVVDKKVSVLIISYLHPGPTLWRSIPSR